MESLVDLVTSDRPDENPGDHLSNCSLDCTGDHPGDCSGDRPCDCSGDRPGDCSGYRPGDQLISPAHHKYYKSLLLSCQPQAKSFWAFFLQLPQFQVEILSSIWNRLISGGLEPVLIHTNKKICLSSYYIQFSMNIKMYNHKIKTSSLARAFGISGPKKLGFKLFIIRCEK